MNNNQWFFCTYFQSQTISEDSSNLSLTRYNWLRDTFESTTIKHSEKCDQNDQQKDNDADTDEDKLHYITFKECSI